MFGDVARKGRGKQSYGEGSVELGGGDGYTRSRVWESCREPHTHVIKLLRWHPGPLLGFAIVLS